MSCATTTPDSELRWEDGPRYDKWRGVDGLLRIVGTVERVWGGEFSAYIQQGDGIAARPLGTFTTKEAAMAAVNRAAAALAGVSQ